MRWKTVVHLSIVSKRAWQELKRRKSIQRKQWFTRTLASEKLKSGQNTIPTICVHGCLHQRQTCEIQIHFLNTELFPISNNKRFYYINFQLVVIKTWKRFKVLLRPKRTFLFSLSFENVGSSYLQCQVSNQNSYRKPDYFNCDFFNWLAAITQLKKWPRHNFETWVESKWRQILNTCLLSHATVTGVRVRTHAHAHEPSHLWLCMQK